MNTVKKCLCCSNSGIFLRLKDGLCPECQENFMKFKDNYKELFTKVTSLNDTKEIPNLVASIKMLSIELRKFDSFSTTLKSSDCEQLIQLLSDLPSSNSLNLNSSEPCTIKEEAIPTEKSDSEQSERSAETKDTNPFDLKLKDLDEEAPKIEFSESKEFDVKDISTEEIIPKKEDEPSREAINPELYTEVQKILHQISDDNISTEDLCYYTFILKNTYLPMMKKYGIKEIDNKNIEALVSSNLKRASLLMNCDVDKLYSYFNYVAFSIQTTGIRYESNNILEIGAVKVQYGKVIEKFHTLINPLKPISLSKEKLLKLSNDELSKAPTIDNVLLRFEKFIGDATLISHNSNYHYGFIKYNYEKVFEKPFNRKTECTMKLYRKRYTGFYGEPPKDSALNICCKDLLSEDIMNRIKKESSVALSCAEETHELYEIVKKKYK